MLKSNIPPNFGAITIKSIGRKSFVELTLDTPEDQNLLSTALENVPHGTFGNKSLWEVNYAPKENNANPSDHFRIGKSPNEADGNWKLIGRLVKEGIKFTNLETYIEKAQNGNWYTKEQLKDWGLLS
jgi:hypothetical protein